MRTVLASGNTGKLKELRALLSPLGLTLDSQADHNVEGAEETGQTFVENALLKARWVCRQTGLPAIADDSGLVVPALDGQPGIYSARYAGAKATDTSNNNKLLNALKTVSDRRAYFYCAMIFLRHDNDPTPLIATGAWHGSLAPAPQGEGGFGYDPLFIPDGLETTAAELSAEEKRSLSHRGQACEQLSHRLAQILARE